MCPSVVPRDAYVCNSNRQASGSRSVRCSNPLRPNDGVDTYTARQRKGDKDILNNGDIDGDKDDVADAGNTFDCHIAIVSLVSSSSNGLDDTYDLWRQPKKSASSNG